MTRGRPKTDRKRKCIELDQELYGDAQAKRREFQLAEGVDISQIDWHTRLIQYALKHIKPDKPL